MPPAGTPLVCFSLGMNLGLAPFLLGLVAPVAFGAVVLFEKLFGEIVADARVVHGVRHC